jgi:ankyrin repeat protein
VLSGHVDTVIALLDAGAAIEAPGRSGRTPGMLAAMSGQLGGLYVLLQRGGDVDATAAETGNTALMLAANRGRLDVVRMLLAAGAEVNARAKDGWTALEAAEMVGDDEIATLLRQAGAAQ